MRAHPTDTYLFIDGEYLRQIHRDVMQDFFGADGDIDFSAIKRDARAIRALVYDSIDDEQREGESEETRVARIAPLERFYARARALSGVHVRLGTVVGKRGRKKKEPRQKEVDILLATDMLTHGFNGSMGKAVLLSGDLDFRPVVETLVRHGVFVEVWYHRSSIAEDLPGAADFGRELRLRQLHSWNTEAFQRAYQLPQAYEHAGAPVGELVRVGSIAGYPVELRRLETSSGTLFNVWITVGPGDTLRIYDANENLLERYVESQHGPIEWKVAAEELRVTEDQ
jgi:uncharacterized LabA/DUF88 family protein